MRSFWIFGFVTLMIASCSQEDSSINCTDDLFNPKKKINYLLEDEQMVLKRVATTDTSFLYLQWFDDANAQILLVFNPASEKFIDAEPGTHYNISGAVKVSCANSPTINNQPTEVIELFTAEKIAYCEVEVEQEEPREIKQTYWRFQGFRSQGQVLPPTCEENFLYVVFTTSSTNPINPENSRFFIEIYNGVKDCDYVYEFFSPTIAKITQADCFRDNLATTKGSERYGDRFMLGLLDPDAIHLTHFGNQLIIRPENFTDEMIFIGL